MKIMYWTEMFWPNIGGLEVFGMNLLPALRRRGHEFTIITSQLSPKLTEEDEYQGIPIYRFSFRPALDNYNLAEIKEIHQRISQVTREFAPDLVHLSISGSSIYTFFYLRVQA